mmetsp:Transcript_8113/g.22019  ORF Transcript_8113/g.22019 Transcript_8113/m.22019 type:complete len:138 (-) Transcript_8113:50-463(-)
MASELIKKLSGKGRQDMGAWAVQPGGKQTESVSVDLGWCTETVLIHPEGGPQVYQEDGSYFFLMSRGFGWSRNNGGVGIGTKNWGGMSSTEKSVAIEVAAKRNAAMKDRYGEDYFNGARLPSGRDIAVAKRAMGVRT